MSSCVGAIRQGAVKLLNKSTSTSPLDIQFRRQAVRRLLFDQDSAISLSDFNPAEVVNLNIEHPQSNLSGGAAHYTLRAGHFEVSAEQAGESSLWIGGFNPFATYDVAFEQTNGNDIEVGVEFASRQKDARVTVLAGFSANKCTQIRWQVIIKGRQKQNAVVSLERPIVGPFVLRVQMLGSGLNVFAVQQGVHRVLDARDFSRLIDLRRKDRIRSFEFSLFTRLSQNSSVVISKVGAALTTGAGQADLCAITNKDGAPLLDQGRLWFTMSIRGRGLDHSLQGVFSMNPSVFDVRLEGIIVFDREDGLLRNDIASHIFYDNEADEWRGLTVGFSAYGDSDKGAGKQLWAVSSKRDPRFGFSVMKARDVVIPGAAEDPHLVFDGEANKWRVLVCGKGGAGFPATLYEANAWNGPYERIAGPAKVNGTGCLLQKFGSTYYALFGSSDRKFYVYSYPELQPLGALNMSRPSWDDRIGTRCWPNVIPLPEGFPAPYIALTMDRQNFPELSGWNYGALYLYHGFPIN